MAHPPYATEGAPPGRVVDSGRLWAGGIAGAVVAALAGIVNFLVVRGLFGIPVLAPEAVAPFLSGAALSAEIATAAINMVVGVAVWCLVAGVARSAVRRDAARTVGRLPGSLA